MLSPWDPYVIHCEEWLSTCREAGLCKDDWNTIAQRVCSTAQLFGKWQRMLRLSSCHTTSTTFDW